MRYAAIGLAVLATLALGLYLLTIHDGPSTTTRIRQPLPTDSARSSMEPGGNAETQTARSALATRYNLSEQELQEKLQRREYRQAAEARFKEAVKMDGLSPGDVDPRVRELFAAMKLEPAFDPETNRKGSVKGMRIARLGEDNPLARAGFRTGDLLTRLNGEALRDPARIAHLFTRVSDRMDLCARRAGQTECASVKLER